MKNFANVIPQTTIKDFAEKFFKEADSYGFNQLDYLRYVNLVLDLSLKNNDDQAKTFEKASTL